ncbi:hypothetical protein QVD17_24772 [Tagetes erecta]|uniref:Protein kinase domain-containing protein n=1 Tax=Tagetes erecta TaxID=13708 RepID=A0AAD8NUY8_TARER|nr:hypothetical protein QVD17_24772 [Tagetes erecta]
MVSFSSISDYLEPSVPVTPYVTARIFNSSSFTYTFPVSKGPKFLRLHFYPATYSNLKPHQFLFSVSSNDYNLLTNFSAFLTVSYIKMMGTDARVVKEFLIYVKDTQTLNVTFTPSPNSYAFINGIEVVSMPENMYFNSKIPKYVNRDRGPIIDNDIALENMYRLNMGGRYVSSNEDTGMYRSWDADYNYILGAEMGVVPACNNPILYTTQTPNYTAPELVYHTQRSMGKLADKYNLTWILPVDSGFYYMLRLHFCNIIPQYSKSGAVVFTIFINNQIAEKEADPFNWTQGSGYPVFQDYIMFVHDSVEKRVKQDLWIEMHPNPHYEKYSDAYLNGVEVFKLSMDKNLASRNPEVDPVDWPPTGKRKNKKTPYAMIIGGIGGAFVWSSIIGLIVFWIRRRVKHDGAANHISSYDLAYRELESIIDRCRHFSVTELKAVTCEFNDKFVIGTGGFGKVYKGCMDNATTTVAIKRLDSTSKQGFQEFHTELKILSKLQHINLVSLIGYCDDEGEMILVYDYMANGTLREHLYNTNKPHLSWKRRLNICIGVAKGLHYLHSGGKCAAIHGDVKSANILLDENWVAKLSDFGLSKLCSEDQLEIHVNTMVKGSLGYVDPEYCLTQQITKKSDVYSFGVVLLEVLCARPVIVVGLRDEQVSLVEWCKTCYKKGNLVEIIDPKLNGEIAPRCLRKFGEVASKCLHEEGSERPAIEEVVWRLEFALQLQEDADKMQEDIEKMDGPETETEKNQEHSFINGINL